MSEDISDRPQVTRFIGSADLEYTEPDHSRVCYQFNQAQFHVQYTKREALKVAFAVLIDQSGNLPAAISTSFISVLMLVRRWWKLDEA